MPPDSSDSPLGKNLKRALKRLARGPLRAGTTRLLNVLGYHSERTMDGIPASLEALQKDEGWPDVQIIFQITEEEIQKILGRKDSRDSAAYEQEARQDENYQSLLFLAIDLPNASYNRVEFARVTKAVNSIFQMPVIVLFRCAASSLALAVVHRRARKRPGRRSPDPEHSPSVAHRRTRRPSGQSSRPVLGQEVKLTRNIQLKDPSRAQLHVLLSIRAAKGSRNFLQLHEWLEKMIGAQDTNKKFDLDDWFSWAEEKCRFPGDDTSGFGHVWALWERLDTVWCLKEQGKIPPELFDEDKVRSWLRDYSRESTDYYRAILQNLFFVALNTQSRKRGFGARNNQTRKAAHTYKYSDLFIEPGRDAFVSALKSVPVIDDDVLADRREGRRSIEAFTESKRRQKELDVPAYLFFDPDQGLFALLDRHLLGKEA